ncbi:MAG: hypothetical protein ABI597_04215 [Gammaproteobacteria bacterium]
MTENLLQKLEEKMLTLLSELENVRSELNRVKQENSYLRVEQANYSKKLQGLISLLDSESNDMPSHEMHETETVQPGEGYVTA